MRPCTRSFSLSLCATILLAALSSPARAQIPVFVNGWGSFGTGDTQFKTPVGVAFDLSDNVYVCDTNNQRVQKFTHSGQYLTQWPAESPRGLAVDGSGNVFVVSASQVWKFSNSGSLLAQFGQADGYNRGVAVNHAGEVYVVGVNWVRKFSNDGVFVLEWGSTGSADGQFNTADGIAVDPAGYVYVVDYDGRIQKFTGDGAPRPRRVGAP